MRKIIITSVIAAISALSAFAQNMETATTAYNEGVTALNAGNRQGAIEHFRWALEQAELIGPEAEEIAYNCKRSIPLLISYTGKELAAENLTDSAIAVLKNALDAAIEYEQDDVVTEVSTLISQLYMKQGNQYFNQKKYNEAISYYKEVLASNPSDATAYLRLGQSELRSGDIDAAITALNKAAELGQSKAANREIASAYLNRANSLLRSKRYMDAIENAQKALDITVNPQALQIAGTAAFAIKDYNKSIKYFEQLLQEQPNFKAADEIKYRLATAYETLGNKEGACRNYRAIASNPQFKEYAEHKIKEELKCQ